jgi:hypothetical protein
MYVRPTMRTWCPSLTLRENSDTFAECKATIAGFAVHSIQAAPSGKSVCEIFGCGLLPRRSANRFSLRFAPAATNSIRAARI